MYPLFSICQHMISCRRKPLLGNPSSGNPSSGNLSAETRFSETCVPEQVSSETTSLVDQLGSGENWDWSRWEPGASLLTTFSSFSSKGLHIYYYRFCSRRWWFPFSKHLKHRCPWFPDLAKCIIPTLTFRTLHFVSAPPSAPAPFTIISTF